MPSLSTPNTSTHPIPGMSIGSTAANIRVADRLDLTVFVLAPGSISQAMFTQNRFCAAPVQVAKQHLASAMPRALVINTAYANAGTGDAGLEVAQKTCEALAKHLDCEPNEVLPFSTGIIGESLPLDRLIAGLPSCLENMTSEKIATENWSQAANAIMTTDTRPKVASRKLTLDGKPVHITGISKGAGMICPNMATMLGFIGTDAKLSKETLNTLLKKAVTKSFNRITIDGDTSTNDAVVLTATGKSDVAIEELSDSEALAFEDTLIEVFVELAQAIVKDGEGATKFVSIEVKGAATETDGLTIAKTIAHSPLVKTALFAEDPNWGRIIAALGRAPVETLNLKDVTLAINGLPVFADESVASDYDEGQVGQAMKETNITLTLEVGDQPTEAVVWTSDLSHDYVSINADYRS